MTRAHAWLEIAKLKDGRLCSVAVHIKLILLERGEIYSVQPDYGTVYHVAW